MEGELTEIALFSDFFFLITDWIISTSARLSCSKEPLEPLLFSNANSSVVFVTSRSHSSAKVRLSISLESILIVLSQSSFISISQLLHCLSKRFHNSHIEIEMGRLNKKRPSFRTASFLRILE